MVPEEDEDSFEDEIGTFSVEYICEECDYKWREDLKPELYDDFRGDDNGFDFDDSEITCPMCGSFLVSRL